MAKVKVMKIERGIEDSTYIDIEKRKDIVEITFDGYYGGMAVDMNKAELEKFIKSLQECL
jgi:hypothetical protein